MLRYSYKVELKRAETELLGLFLDLNRVPEEKKEAIKEKIREKDREIEWIKNNKEKHNKPFVI